MASSSAPSPLESFARIAAVARNTWRETMRDRLMLGILAFLAAMQALIYAMETGGAERAPATLDVSLLMMSGVGTLVAIFLGASLVYKELDKRTVYIVLSKPVSRLEFLLGKYMGLMGTLGLVVGLMTGCLSLLMLALGYFRPEIYAICFGLWVELGMVTAMSFMFAAVTNGTLSALYAACLFVLGHGGEMVRLFADSEVKLSAFNYYVGHAMYYALPHFEVFDLKGHILYGNGLPWVSWLAAQGYGVLMIATWLLVAAYAWETRELL